VCAANGAALCCGLLAAARWLAASRVLKALSWRHGIACAALAALSATQLA